MNDHYKYALGWLPDYPDFRDYTVEKKEISAKLKALGQHDSINAMLKQIGVTHRKKTSLPAAINLTQWCSPIEDQGAIGSCTAHAGVGLVEYFERKAFAKHCDASRLFLYKATRNMLQWTGGYRCIPAFRRRRADAIWCSP